MGVGADLYNVKLNIQSIEGGKYYCIRLILNVQLGMENLKFRKLLFYSFWNSSHKTIVSLLYMAVSMFWFQLQILV